MTKLLAIGALVLALCVGAVAFVSGILRAHLAYTHASIGWSRAAFDGLRITLTGPDPVLEADHAEIAYNLRDLAVGSQRALGLAGFTADRPHITLVHYPDGTWNAPIQQKGGKGPNLSIGAFVFDARVHDGSITVRDETLPHSAVRELRIDGIQISAHIDQRRRSTYRVDGALVDGARTYPITGRGLWDDRIGFEENHWRSRALPLKPLAGFALSMPQASVAGGSLDYIDAHYFGLADKSGTMDYHLAASGYLNGLRVYLRNLHASVRNLHGHVYAYDDGATTPRADAELVGIPIVIAGGVFNLAKPELRFGLRARASLVNAARIATVLAGKNVAGDVTLAALAEGSVTAPLVLASLRSNAVSYGKIPLRRLDALVAVQGTVADVVHAGATYGPLTMSLRGETLLNSTRANAEGVVRVRGPLQKIPYAAALPGTMDLDVVAVAAGTADAFSAGGIVSGTGPGEELAGTMRIAPDGSGSIGPLVLDRVDGSSLYARVAVDRKNGENVGLIDAERLPLDTRRNAELPGIKTAALPAFQARLSARAGAELRDKRLAAGMGNFTARGSVAGGTLLALGNFSSANDVDGIRARAGVVLSRASYRKRRIDAGTALRYSHGRLELGGASASYGAAVALLDGSVAGLSGGTAGRRYDLRARTVGAPLTLIAALAGRRLPYPEGSIDADVRLRGAGTSPSVAGTVAIPEGSINGLAFSDASVKVGGTPQALDARNGRVTVGTTRVAFDGAYRNGTASGSVRAPHADLADFNEYFDVADTLAGKGAIATTFTLGPGNVATSGDVDLRGVRIRRFALGQTVARWSTQGRTVATQASISGTSGRLRMSGTVAVPPSDPMRDLIRRSDLNLTASARGIDLRQYLPLLSLNAPVTGILDADATVRGRYPALAATGRAEVTNGSIARLPLQTATASVSAGNGRARIDSAKLAARHLSVTASGDVGLRPTDTIDLTAHIKSDDVGALYNEAMGKTLDVAGRLDSTLRIGGSPRAPAIADTLALDDLRYASFRIPHAGAQIVATRATGTLSKGEVDFIRGRLLASGVVPIDRTAGPMRVALNAQTIDLGSFAALLPKGSKLGGALNGALTIAGTIDDPRMDGGLTLAGGTFSGPFLRSDLTAMGATVAFTGHQVAVNDASAKIGGGTIGLTGSASVPNFRTPSNSVAFRIEARTGDAGFDVPNYFRGKVNADVIVTRAAGSPAGIGGNVAIEHARIPVNAIYNPNASKSKSPFALPVAFNDLGITLGQDVRVQSSVIDVGAQGHMTIAGTLAQPRLAGAFDATGGTVDVYHSFRVVRGHVAFTPDQGLMPTVNALATTSIDNPPTDIALHVTGTVPNLDLGLTSAPSYSRAQILGLLLGVQALGAVQGLPQTGGSTQAFNAGTLAENEAEGALRTQLTRGIFEPLQSSLGNSLGLNNLQLYLNDSGGFEAHATKGLAKHLNAIFAESFGPVSRQIVGVRATPTDSLALQATVYQQQGAAGFTQYNPSYLQTLSSGYLNQTLIATTPSSGTNGYSLSVQRRYP
jgi:hypothetical protein